MAVGLFQPSSNPAPNPAGFAQAASGIYDTMQQLAAQGQHQQQVQQQQSLKDQFETELKLRKEGYTPFMQTTGQDSSGLKRRDSQQVDPSRVISDHFGRKWVAPAPDPAATPQQTFSDTEALDKAGARPIDTSGNVAQDTNIPRYRDTSIVDADRGHVVQPGPVVDTGMFGINGTVQDQSRVRTVPGSSQKFYMPTQGEQDKSLADKLRTEASAKEGTPTVDTEHFSTPVSINHRTGEVTPLKMPAGVTHNDKPEKPDKYTYNHFADDNGKVTITRIGPDDSTPEMWDGKAWKPVPAGAAIATKRESDVAARAKEAAADRKEAAAQRERDAGQKSIETLQAQEQKTHSVRSAYSDVLWDPATGKEIADGTMVEDPKTGKQVPLNAARRTYYKRQFQSATDQVQTLQQRQQAIAGRFGGNGAAAPAQAQSKGKLTDQSKASEYLQKAGGNKDKARQLAKADGWEF